MARTERRRVDATVDVSGPRAAALNTWSVCAAVLGLLVAGAAVVAQSNMPTTRSSLDREQIDALVAKLVHPQFKVRTEASQTLSNLSDESLPVLIAAYHEQLQLELRLQLRKVIENVFYQRQLQGRIGFLGLGPRAESNVFDPATGKLVDVMYVCQVLPGFPAQQAGVAAGDMIVDFDGKSIAEISAAPRKRDPRLMQLGQAAQRLQMQMPSDTRIDAFTAEVSRREPGSTVPLRVLRAQAAQRTVEVTIPEDPAQTLDGASLVPMQIPNLQTRFDERIGPSLITGLYISAVTAGSRAAAAQFKPGDVIMGISQKLSMNTVPADQLANQIKSAGPGNTVRIQVNHVRELTIPVTLGGRPVDRMNPLDMEIAQARFADWWRTQTGETSYRNSRRVYAQSDRRLPEAELLR